MAQEKTLSCSNKIQYLPNQDFFYPFIQKELTKTFSNSMNSTSSLKLLGREYGTCQDFDSKIIDSVPKKIIKDQ